jgi:transcriptional regulator with XRE-family HTH domain
MRTYRSKASDRGKLRARELARAFGRELRAARMSAGMTQSQTGSRAGVSQQAVSLAERGSPAVSLETRARLTEACGCELGWRLYPVRSIPLRDSGQLKLASALVARAHATFRARLEVPVRPGDLRAADLVLESAEEVVHVEIERAPTDFQAQARAAQVKREMLADGESRPVRLVLALPSTQANRDRLNQISPLLLRTLPVPSRRIWHAIQHGMPIGGDGILLMVPTARRRTT